MYYLFVGLLITLPIAAQKKDNQKLNSAFLDATSDGNVKKLTALAAAGADIRQFDGSYIEISGDVRPVSGGFEFSIGPLGESDEAEGAIGLDADSWSFTLSCKGWEQGAE